MEEQNQMNKKKQPAVPKPILVSISFAIIGMILLFVGLSKYKAKLGYNMNPVKVLIASQILEENHVLNKKDFTIEQIPKKYIPVGALLPSDAEKVAGHVVIRPMAKGEIVLWSAIDVGFSPTGPSRRITKGYRAIAIDVDPSTSVAQSVRQGDFVDMVAVVSMPGESTPTTVTILQNVAVLNVGTQAATDESEAYSTVSLMVLPKEVGLIVHAQKFGNIILALRHPEDQQTLEDLRMVGMNQLIEAAFRNSLQKERNEFIEIIRGGKTSFH